MDEARHAAKRHPKQMRGIVAGAGSALPGENPETGDPVKAAIGGRDINPCEGYGVAHDEAGFLSDFADEGGPWGFPALDAPTGQRPLALARGVSASDQQDASFAQQQAADAREGRSGGFVKAESLLTTHLVRTPRHAYHPHVMRLANTTSHDEDGYSS